MHLSIVTVMCWHSNDMHSLHNMIQHFETDQTKYTSPLKRPQFCRQSSQHIFHGLKSPLIPLKPQNGQGESPLLPPEAAKALLSPPSAKRRKILSPAFDYGRKLVQTPIKSPGTGRLSPTPHTSLSYTCV